MPDIRYVCLSDTHFGAATSLLTSLKIGDEIDGLKPSPVMEKLVECLRYLIDQNQDKTKKPTLVLNGDILELALADAGDADMTFERFIDLTMDAHPGEMFDQIYYIPGNHDHHLWEMARESQHVDYIAAQKPWGSALYSPWHTTRMFSDPTRAYFLTALVQRRHNLKNMIIQTAYPNFGLLSEDRKRCVVFHHGHFVESMYILMSILKTMLFPGSRIPSEIRNLEAENFAWIDFFCSTLGRSSAVGQGVSRIYEELLNEAQVRQLLSNMAEGLSEQYGSSWAGGMEAKVLSWAFDAIYSRLGSLERNQPEQVLSQDADQGLYGYMDGLPNQTDSQGSPIGPLTHQMADEKFAAEGLDRFTFVFGHTHKPFQDVRNFRNFPGRAQVYNSGGWVVDTAERQHLHGGAVILIDENLEATSLRMYNESSDPHGYAVSVQEARHPGDPPGAFQRRISGLVAQAPDLWTDFSQTVARTISVRAQKLHRRINFKSPSKLTIGFTLAKVFISYAREDESKAKEIYDKLKKAGFQPWLDKEDLLPGQNWKIEIPKAIRNADSILLLFSEDSVVKRGYVQNEFKMALETLRNLPVGVISIIPVRLNKCEIPEEFNHLEYSNYFEDEGFEKVLKSLKMCKSS